MLIVIEQRRTSGIKRAFQHEKEVLRSYGRIRHEKVVAGAFDNAEPSEICGCGICCIGKFFTAIARRKKCGEHFDRIEARERGIFVGEGYSRMKRCKNAQNKHRGEQICNFLHNNTPFVQKRSIVYKIIIVHTRIQCKR